MVPAPVYRDRNDKSTAMHRDGHRDRLAAIQRHFGQQVASLGDPDADHALAFVQTIADPEGLYAPQPAEAPIGRVVEITYNGIKRQVRVDANGRVVAESRATKLP
jgi:hypothetical protein